MNIGALLGPVLDPAAPRFLAEQAKRYAGEGFTSLWMAQAIGRGFMMPDPLQSLAVAASVTDDVELGTAILQLPLYQSADLAHRVLSLSQLCGDRLILGVGAGSSEPDFERFERNFPNRFEAFNNTLSDLREALTSGRTQSGDLSAWPATLNRTRLFFGTWGKGVERAANHFDGWIASGMYRDVDELENAARKFFAAGGARAIVSTIQINHESDMGLLKENFARYSSAGFTDAVVMLLPGSASLADVRQLVE